MTGRPRYRLSAIGYQRALRPLVPWVMAVSILAAQQPTPPPRFITTTELVLVDVSVLDGDGNPVPDVTAAEFELTVNGTTRPIHSVDFVRTQTTPRSAAPERRISAPPEYSTNQAETTGRFVLIAVDENYLRVGAARSVIRNAERILDSLAPGDQVGFARLPKGTGGVEFTADRAPIREALNRLRGAQPSRMIQRVTVGEAWASHSGDKTAWQKVVERECGLGADIICGRELEADAKTAILDANFRTSSTINALEQLLKRLAAIRAPMNLVFISEGLFISRERHDLTQIARLAAEARVTFHIIQNDESMFDRDKPEVLLGFDPVSILGTGLEMIAGYTRGSLYRVSTSGAGVMDRIARELSGYYVLSFEPTDADRASRDRKIRVTVKRRGVEVRARTTYALSETPTSAPVTPHEQIRELLLAHSPATAVPLRVASYAVPIAGSKDQFRIILSAEIGEPVSDVREWSVGLYLFDKAGKAVLNHAQIPIKLKPATARRPSASLLVNSFTVARGDYTLRLAAVAGDGRTGSVHHRLHADVTPLTGGGDVNASPLIVASEPEKAGEPLKPMASPVVDRDSVSLALELTANDAKRLAATRVAFQIAATETAAPLITTDAEAIAYPGGRQRAFLATVKVGSLPAGDYLARAVISVPGRKDSVVLRRFLLVTQP